VCARARARARVRACVCARACVRVYIWYSILNKRLLEIEKFQKI